MSEKEAERVLFEGLSEELEDPTLQKSMDEAKSLDERLRLSDEDNIALRTVAKNFLDKQWSQWTGERVTVTGFAHRVLGDNDIRPDPVLITPDDIIISRGFSIVHTDIDGENIHGNPYGSQYRVMHDLRRQTKKDRYERLLAFIDNHDVQSDIMSAEYAERWLHRTQPDFLSHLQEALHSGNRVGGKLVQIGTRCEPGLFLDVFNKKNRAAVEAYINSAVSIDTEVPYILTTRKGRNTFEAQGREYKTTKVPLRTVGKMSKVYFQEMMPHQTNNEAGDWWLSVKAETYSEDLTDENQLTIVPLHALKNVRSLREFGYDVLRHFEHL